MSGLTIACQFGGCAVGKDKNQTDFQQYRRGFRNNHLPSLENLLVSITNLAPFEQVTFKFLCNGLNGLISAYNK